MLTIFVCTAAATFLATSALLRHIEQRMLASAMIRYRIKRLVEEEYTDAHGRVKPLQPNGWPYGTDSWAQ